MYTAIIALIQHNAFQTKFEWLIVFEIATEVDPNYTFINHLKTLKYSDENLSNFIDICKSIKPYTINIKLEPYVEIAKWLIQLCRHKIDTLYILWRDVLIYNNEIENNLLKCFGERIRECISHDDAVALEYHFKEVPVNWTKENITAIKRLLHDDTLY
ncbi:hypothetical protein RclHR1_05780005 [Rhizophagus clarus]|nr:hypothetical protein RclHR1_05780005 [Rhizophagus clarus]